MEVIPLKSIHYQEVKTIFEDGIATKNATFTTEAPEWEDWDALHLPICRFVAIDKKKVVGWIALMPFSNVPAYRGVAEISVYIAEKARNKGIGKKLMEAVISEAESNFIWMLHAKIFPENMASIALHKHFGFRVVGVFEQIGQLDNQWRNVMLMERRSQKVGL
ncbi:MAG: N-acetyltransferase family protein [Flavobacteriaceae bacterium]|jgi:phosphinothricin acetyltransferase|nr:N-acetyltransferase family protein [Flavobacteriaceae bacterium]